MSDVSQSVEHDWSAQNATERGVAQFFGFDLFEHYESNGSLLVVTSDASAIRLEPGDFIVRRVWSTAAMPYVYNEARQHISPGLPTDQ